MQDNIAIVLLAAGSSSRMGQPKQLLPWKDKTLLGHAIEKATSTGLEVFVLLGANKVEIEGQVDFSKAVPLIHSHWKDGIGSTIAFAISEIVNRFSSINAIVIALADQPFVSTEHYEELVKEYKINREVIIATTKGDYLGVPALFPQIFFSQLKSLENDEGAKKIINQNRGQVRAIPTEVDLFDIDTIPEYYIARNKVNNL